MYKIIFTLLILFSATAYGAEVDNALLQKNLEAANLQIEVLKAQVEVMKSYQDKFLSTVYWSLGTVGAFVVFFAGFNWFTNTKNQEKESQLLKDNITKEIEASKQILINDIDNKKSIILNDVQKQVEENFNSKLTAIRNSLIDISKEVKSHEYSLLKIEYEEWMTKKVYANAVTTALELIAASQKIGYEYFIEESVEKLIFVLEKGVEEKKKSTIDVGIMNNISKTTSSLSNHYVSSKLKIEGLITKLNNLL
ncbi:hypothetical protein [Acinetobacter junii]|uniref:hypothetical protein n=1 Tax=Acinetobacter junii TaxID=40215 RepID=UPI003A8B50E0